DFVDAWRVDQHHLRLAQTWQCISSAVPSDVPNLARPAATDIDAGNLAADKGVDKSAFAGRDLAEDHDFDAAACQLVEHLPQAGQLAAEAGFFLIAALPHAVERLLDGG